MIYFRLRLVAKPLNIDSEDVISFTMMRPEPISVELRRLADAELGEHYRKGDVLCTAALQKMPTRKISLWVAKPEGPLPAGFSDFTHEAHHALSDAAVHALKLWRWRMGYPTEPNPVRFLKSFEWSGNRNDWTPIPNVFKLNISFDFPIRKDPKVTEDIVKSLKSLSLDNTQEPLGHELFQEAWSQRDDNPRSSLVMGIAAAETGVKHLISTLVPAAAWLVEEIPSPPLVQILEKYVPSLPARLPINGKVLPPPDWLMKIITKGVQLRNKIVHGHQTELKSDSLREILVAVRDLLYLYDLYAGHDWAVQYLSVRMVSSLRNEA
jgi:hypothetical protein